MSPPRLTFDEAEKALAAFQTRGWRLGLDRMNAFVDELCLRDYVTGPARPKYFHVAGTNGKGSTTCAIQHLLHEHGYRVGVCYSPYVYDVRERVQIGLDLISKDEFAACAEILMAAGERLERTEFGGPTEFEMKIAMGFLAWQRAGVDAVALETGMGGRLDATNVVDPACSIITTIGLDHTEHLGTTLAAIAGEKAGIIKRGRPVISGRLVEEALTVIESKAEVMGADLSLLGRHFDLNRNTVTLGKASIEIQPAMPGIHQLDNAAMALAALDAAGVILRPELCAKAIGETRLPGRMEIRREEGRLVIRDGAHNREAARVLRQAIQAEFPGRKFTLVWGMLKGHDAAEFLAELHSVVEAVHPVEVHAAHRESYTSQELMDIALAVQIGASLGTESMANILVTGSFYLLSQVDF